MATIALTQMLLFCALPLPQPSEIQQAGLEARQKIVSGDMEYEIYDGFPPVEPQQEIDWKLNLRDHLIFDTRSGWSAYLERWQPNEPILLKDGQTLTQRAPGGGNRLRIVLNPAACYQYIPDEVIGGSRFGTTSDDPKSYPIESKFVMHPWKLGLIPENFGVQHAFDIKDLGAYVSPPKQPDVIIDEDSIDGRNCWRIAYRRDGKTVTTWFDPACAMNVCKVVETGTTKYGPFVVSATSRLKYDLTAGVWFPDEIVYRGVVNGDEQDASLEKLVVKQSAFNIDFVPSQFTAKALDAPPHTLILSRKPEPGPTKQWDGEKVTPITPLFPIPETSSPQQPTPPVSTRQMLIVAGVILLFFAAVIGLSRKAHA